MEVTLTFQDGELGAGVDLPTSVGGRALVDGFVPVGAQRLDAQHGARAVIKLNHLSQDQSRTSGHAPRPRLSHPGPLESPLEESVILILMYISSL